LEIRLILLTTVFSMYAKFILLTSLCWLGLVSAPSAQGTLSPGTAVNVAGKQRFLSQRIGKAFMYKFLGKNADVAARELQTSMVLFEENLKALKATAPKTTAPLLARNEALYADFRKLLLAEPTKESAQAVLNTNSQLLAATNDVLVDMTKWLGTLPPKTRKGDVPADLVTESANQSSRMRMLSQRLAFYYAAYVAGLNTPNNDIVKQIQQMATSIQGGITSLVTSEANTTEIEEAISTAVMDWREIEEKCTVNNCISFEEKAIDPVDVFNSTNKMQSKIDKITSMYAKLLD
jgi:hypothetical protein